MAIKTLFIYFVVFGVQNQPVGSSAYKPQVEAISPTLPVDNALENQIRHSRDELVQNIHRIDREITNMDHTIEKLKRKQVRLYNVYIRSSVQLEFS